MNGKRDGKRKKRDNGKGLSGKVRRLRTGRRRETERRERKEKKRKEEEGSVPSTHV